MSTLKSLKTALSSILSHNLEVEFVAWFRSQPGSVRRGLLRGKRPLPEKYISV